MKLKAIICIFTLAVFLSCCLHEAEGTFGKLKLLKLVKAGLILKALKPKKIPIILPIPIPIGIHHQKDHFDGGHHGHIGHFDGGHHSYHHGFHGGYEPHYGHHSFGGGHSGFGFKTSGYHIQTGGHFW